MLSAPAASGPGLLAIIMSSKAIATSGLDLILAPKSLVFGAAATAFSLLKSVITSPPAVVTAPCIWAAVTPFLKRTIMIPNGLRLLLGLLLGLLAAASTGSSRAAISV